MLRLHSLIEGVKQHLELTVKLGDKLVDFSLVLVSLGQLSLSGLDLQTLRLNIDIHIVVDINVDNPRAEAGSD